MRSPKPRSGDLDFVGCTLLNLFPENVDVPLLVVRGVISEWGVVSRVIVVSNSRNCFVVFFRERHLLEIGLDSR